MATTRIPQIRDDDPTADDGALTDLLREVRYLRASVAALLPAVEELLATGRPTDLPTDTPIDLPVQAPVAAPIGDSGGSALSVRQSSPSGPDPMTHTGWDELTETERTIARLIAQAMTNRQIATRLSLSPHTINYHLRRMFKKLAINSRVQLVGLSQQPPTGPESAT